MHSPAHVWRSIKTPACVSRSINTAWLSVAASVAALVLPSSYGVYGEVEWVAVSLAAVFTVIGALARCPAAACSDPKFISTLQASAHTSSAVRPRDFALCLRSSLASVEAVPGVCMWVRNPAKASSICTQAPGLLTQTLKLFCLQSDFDDLEFRSIGVGCTSPLPPSPLSSVQLLVSCRRLQ